MIATALTEMFGLQHPIVLGPMGGSADAESQLHTGAKLVRWTLEIPGGAALRR